MTLTIVAPSPSLVRNPRCWSESWEELRETAVKSRDQIVLTCDSASPLNSDKFQARLFCYVRTLPRLNDVKSALRRLNTLHEQGHSYVRRADDPVSPNRQYDGETQGHRVPRPTIWKVENSVEGGITVIDALSGAKLMRILEPKQGVMVASMLHAPFRGFINRRLEVIPIENPQDILLVRESSLINTDYVWVGFMDGSIRLFPADSRWVREQDRSVLLARGQLADLVYELPRQHKGAVIAITRSPCHDDSGTTDLVTANRLSSSIFELTAATSRGCREDREHLSLVCTASEDSCVVVWDVRKIYRRLEAMRALSQNARMGGFGVEPPLVSLGGDVVTFNVQPTTDQHGCTVRSTYALVKVRPLLRLKGGVGGLRTLNWVSSAVTTVGYQKGRDVVAMTRDPKEDTASELIKNRRAIQQTTRWEKREEHRVMLRLSEENMREVEKELEQLMPPLVPEPNQRRRVNLIIAGDVHGTVHFWNLDEELERETSEINSMCSTSRTASASRDSRAGQSPLRSLDLSLNSSRRHPAEPAVTSARSSVERRNDGGKLTSRRREFSPRVHTERDTKGKRPNKDAGGEAAGKEQKSSSIPSPLTPGDVKKHVKPRNTVADKGVKTPTRRVSKPPSLNKPGVQLGKQPNITTLRAPHLSPMSSVTADRVKKGNNLAAPVRIGGRGLSSAKGVRQGNNYFCTSPQAKNSLCQSVRSPRSNLTPLATGRRTPRTTEKQLLRRTSKYPRQRPSRGLEGVSDVKKTRTGDSGYFSTACMNKSLNMHPCESSANRSPFRVPRGMPEIETNWTVQWNSPRISNSGSSPSSGRRSPTRHPSPYDATHSARADKEAEFKEWIGGHRYINDMYSRNAKFHMSLIDGVTVTGIAVDLPPIITVTMRRLPDPPEPHYSLLEQPTKEEIRRRELANSFYSLTEERALFCVFERIQFYVSVERTLMNMQCSPKARVDVLGQRVGPGQLEEEGVIVGRTPFNFDIVFRRHVLEMHSQPIVRLFIDHPRRQLWVARNHGLLSVFSTETKSIITRVKGPSADEAIGPPNAAEWKRTQREMALFGRRPIYLDSHKSCRKHRPGYFTGFRPISLLQQFELMRTSLVHELDSERELSTPASETVRVHLTIIEGKDALDKHAKNREIGLSVLLEKLRACRQHALTVRQAQRDNYNALFNGASFRIGSLIGRCATFGVLHAARKIFWSWAHHREYFPRQYVLRQLRHRGMKQLSKVTNAVSLNFEMRLRGEYFTKWCVSVQKRRTYRLETWFARCLQARVKTSLRERFANFMGDRNRRQRYWFMWKSLLAPTARPPSLPALCRSVSPLNSTGVTKIFSPSSVQSMRRSSTSRARVPERNGVFLDMYAIIRQIYGLRQELISFRGDVGSDSVLDVEDPWFDAIEAASEEAEAQTAYALKLAVFKFALVPFLESLLATAEGVLPYIRESPVTEEVRSMLRGCLLCVDYLYADAEDLTSTAATRRSGRASTGSRLSKNGRASLLLDITTRREQEMRQLFDDAMEQREFQSSIESIAAQRETIAEFLRVCSGQ
ncbi:hypothetical protein TCDM_03199 [Trypanosoma cruzi Dm28c]|uniref:Uncharacterized protein n=2 Tax=Trypanosoma cruzi TaxID=5693 RepID=V5BPI5_TRYCR|nr:hypothetical protein TCDM_03199 [Trypanosoma cruzi Dm28c]KAF8288038.1 hypothetical protein TcBrA4_0016620 [Trypanosoma cruzi]PBJ75674.1 hypothetical protein BCY84_10832 [Trypanosoma cruzi cruzi]PWU90754.1 hypothetical protein C4B63_48g138 [Trypanosoma cruzi]